MAEELTADHVLYHIGYVYWLYAKEPKPLTYKRGQNVLQLETHGRTRIVDLFVGGTQLDAMDAALVTAYAQCHVPYFTPEITRRVTLETFVGWVIDPESRP